MTFVSYFSTVGNNTAPTFTIPATAQTGDKVGILFTQNNTTLVTALPASADTTPAGDWTQKESDVSTASFPTYLATFTVGATFAPNTAYHWTLSGTRAWTIAGVVERNIDTSTGTWFDFASAKAVQTTLAGNMPSLNTATNLGASDVEVYEVLTLKANGTAITSISTAPANYTVGATAYTTATTFGGNAAVASRNSSPRPSGTFGGEALSGWTSNGNWALVKTYVLAFKQASSNTTPTANAGSDQSNVKPYTTVALDGTGSSDPDAGDTLTFAWSQTAGTTVTLSSTSASIPTFTAPGTIAGTTLTFSLTVTDNHGAVSAADTVNVIVLPVTERAVIGGVEVPARIQAIS